MDKKKLIYFCKCYLKDFFIYKFGISVTKSIHEDRLKDLILLFKNNHKIEFSVNREFLFMCHNKRMKSHRLAVLAFLKKTNIINDVDWSFMFDSESNVDYNLSPTLKEEIETFFGLPKMDYSRWEEKRDEV